MTNYCVLQWPAVSAPKMTDDLNKYSAAGWKLHSVVVTSGTIVAVLHGEDVQIPAAGSQK